jgi:tetratricopeptide (TPR) repeat protein
MNIFYSIIFLVFAGGIVSDPLDRQIYTYFDNVENQESVSESLWSLIDIFLDNEQNAIRVKEIGDELNLDWVEFFERGQGARSLINRLSIQFENEHLHLFLQLLTTSAEERLQYFSQFYQNSSSTELIDLNESIAKKSVILPEQLNQDSWDFSNFLILFYSRNIDGIDSEFYSQTYRYLTGLKESGFSYSPLVNNLLHASIFTSLYSGDRFNAILAYYDDLKSLDYFPNTVTKRNLYWSLDFALYRTGYINLSLEVQRKHTIPLTIQFGDQLTLNTILATHGGYLYALGRFAEAREVFTTALKDTLHLNNAIKTRLLNNLSLVYYKLGESNKYIENQLNALEFAVERDDYSDQLNIYRNLHIYYRSNRNWDLSLQYINEARQLSESAGNINELVSIIISKSVYYNQYLNDLETAYQLLNDASNLLEESTDYRLKVRTLYELGSLYERKGEYQESRDIYREVLAIVSENNNNAMYLEALTDLANIELLSDNLENAKQYIREFNVHDVTIAEFYVLVNARRIEAEIAFLEGRFRQAEQIINRVYSQVIDRARNTTDIEAGYWHIEESYLYLFQLYADLLIEQNRYNDLTNVLDQLKTINDASLIENPLLQADLLTEEQLTENRRIGQEIDQLRKRLLVSEDSERLEIQNEITSLTARRNQITRKSTPKDLFQNFRTWNIQSRLNHGEMVLHASRILDHLYLVMIDSQNISHKKLPFGSQEEELFENAIRGLTNGNTNLVYLHQIYNFLGLGDLPPHINQLVVAPDSYLYQLPLDVLPVEEPDSEFSYGSASYLIEQMEVRYINNMQEFMRNERSGFFELDFTGIGISDFSHTGEGQLISLPRAPDEIEYIVEGLDRFKNKHSLLESRATPQAFSSSASNSRVLHLASHSKISENDPLFSTIYLYPDDSSDVEHDEISGQIFAYQLFDMNLRNDLIMLNSCESGSGDYFQGSGIMGISRALRYAGARSLILNSWSVNDQFASDFAIEFYSHINQGRSKSASLRNAKIHFLKNNNANPHYWGPYMLNGDSRPIVEPKGKNSLFAFLLVLFFSGCIYTRRRLNGNHLS